MPAAATTVANAFISKANTAGRPLTPMQLMKLVYIAHGWSLGLNGRPLINEAVEAWRYGPVIPELYAATKKYGAQPIREPIPRPLFRMFGPDGLDDGDRNIIEQTFAQYGNLSGIRLSQLTHQAKSPWSATWADGTGQNEQISTDLITEHYRRLGRERNAVPA